LQIRLSLSKLGSMKPQTIGQRLSKNLSPIC
jgi:hypothetical protein